MTQEHVVFHQGERAIQDRANVAADWRERAGGLIRSFMPDQHRTFFERLPVLFLGLLDAQGRPWATLVSGEPGFAVAPDSASLRITGEPLLAETLHLERSAGAKLGLVGVELETRRRNRLNGTIRTESADGLLVDVDQSFGNCPQYIQRRAPAWASVGDKPARARRLERLDDATRSILARADTVFIASRTAGLTDDPRDGVDVSHRGGKPGFLAIGADGALAMPDFSGNRLFNTLGNIEADGRVGLLVLDFEGGSAVLLTGRATIDWSSSRVQAFQGAERVVDVVPEEIWLADDAVPARSDLIQASPVLKRTGTWAEVPVAGCAAPELARRDPEDVPA